MNTDVNIAVTAAEGIAQFDASAKRIMAHRSVLSNVLVRTLPAFRGMEPADVAALILPDVYVSTVPVAPGWTNKELGTDENGDRIVGFNTEDQEINEGEIRYDLIFYVRMPDGISRVIINIELQRRRPTTYPLVNRGIYYACRAISSQKERDFKKQHYEQIKDTYSIWICMNEQENSICDYHLAKEQIMGNADWDTDLDLLHVIIIGVSNDMPEPGGENELHRLLCALYSNQIASDDVLNILEQEYNIAITEDLGEEVNVMCNLGEGILEQGIEQGIEKGIEQGKLQGLRLLMQSVVTGDATIDTVVKIAAGYGVTDEADFRARADAQGIHLPE